MRKMRSFKEVSYKGWRLKVYNDNNETLMFHPLNKSSAACHINSLEKARAIIDAE